MPRTMLKKNNNEPKRGKSDQILIMFVFHIFCPWSLLIEMKCFSIIWWQTLETNDLENGEKSLEPTMLVV